MTKPDAQFILGYNDVIGRAEIPTAIYNTGPSFDSYLTNQLITCDLADSALNYVLPEDDPEVCFPLQLSNSHHCGCSPPNTKGVAMLWTQRSFAVVSMIVSGLLLRSSGPLQLAYPNCLLMLTGVSISELKGVRPDNTLHNAVGQEEEVCHVQSDFAWD